MTWVLLLGLAFAIFTGALFYFATDYALGATVRDERVVGRLASWGQTYSDKGVHELWDEIERYCRYSDLAFTAPAPGITHGSATHEPDKAVGYSIMIDVRPLAGSTWTTRGDCLVRIILAAVAVPIPT